MLSNLFSGLLAQAQQGGWANFVDKAARTPQSKIVLWVAILTIARIGVYFWMRSTPKRMRTSYTFWFAKFLNELFDAIVYAGVFVFLLVRPYLIQAFRIPSGSMIPTLLVNDFIVANKMIYRYTDPKAGDVVVFRPPLVAVTKDELDQNGNVDVDYVKRCIGAPGDVVEIRNGTVFRNGKPINEDYKHYTTIDSQGNITVVPSAADAFPPIVYNFKLVWHKGAIWPVNMDVDGGYIDTGVKAPFKVQDYQEGEELAQSPPAKIPKGYYFMMGDDRNDSEDSRYWGLVPRNDVVGRGEYIWLPISRISRILPDPGN